MTKAAGKTLLSNPSSPPSIRSRLWQLVLVVLLPLLLLVVGLVFAGYRADRERSGQQAQAIARGLALSIESELRARIALLQVLAGSRSLAAGDMATFRNQVLAVLSREDPQGNILLLREDGQVVMSSTQVSDVPLPVRPSLDNLRQVFATGQPSVSDMFFGTVVQRQTIAIDVPVKRADGSVSLVLAMVPSPEALDTLVRQHHPSSGWVMSVYDRQGIIIARTPNPEQFVGKSLSPSFMPLALANDDGLAEVTALDSTPVLVAWNHLHSSGWGVGVAVPSAAFYEPLWRTLSITLAVFGLTVAAALTLAAWVATRIARPIQALADLGSIRNYNETDTVSLGLREADATASLLVAAMRERTAAEAARAKRDAEFFEAQRVGQIGSWRWDPTTDVTTVSEQTLRIFGLDLDRGGLPPFKEQLGCLYPAASWERINVAVNRALETGEGYEFDVEAFRGKTPIWVTIHGEALHDSHGRPSGLRGTVQDVTVRKHAELDLAKSEARFRAAVRAVSGILWTNNANGAMEGEQAGWAMLTGQTPAEYQGYGWANAVHPDDAQSTVDAWNETVRERKPFVFEHRVRRHDGVWRRFAIRAIPVMSPNDSIYEWVGVHTDITEQREAEAALAESAERLRIIVETVPVGLVMAELPSGRIIGGNNYVEAMLRHPVLPSPDINSYDEWISFHADGTRVRGTEYPLARMVLANEDNPSIEVQYQRGDGTRAWTRIVGRPVRDASGKFVGGVVALLDIDGERRAREALEEVNRHLEERVLAEVAARETAQKSARHAQHMQAVGQLAGGVAHEFNNILQAIQGGATLIDGHASEPDYIHRLARIIVRASERGGAITSGLLSFAQQAHFEAERIEPAAMLAELGGMFAHTLGAANLVRVETQPGLPFIVADKVQLETALVNLATNGRDAMREGGTLTMSANTETMTDDQAISGLRPGRYVRIMVSDTGTGMDADTLAHAADPFFTTKEPGRGSGLGLSMAKGFVEQSGGALTIDSRLGHGTSVALWLPAAEDVAGQNIRTPAPEKPTSAGRCVLIVDDEELVRDVLAMGLEDAGFSVLTASGGSDALALLRRGEMPDVLVSDFSMPDMDGVALIREIQVLCPGLPAALLTGFAPTDSRLLDAGMRPGDFPVLCKPIVPSQLITEIESLLTGVAC